MTLLRWLFLLSVMLAAACGDHSGSTDIALAASVPHGWRYVSYTPVRPRADRVAFSRQALAAALKAGHTAPLFALTDGSAAETAGINLRRRTDRDHDAVELLAAMSTDAPHLNIDRAAEATDIAGHDAAHVLMRDDDGTELPVMVILTTDYVLTIAAALPAGDAQSAARQRYAAFVASIALDDGGPQQ